eukprot:SAG31_NODE_7454_length_1685_cov_2.784994_3_plen_216_part_01
MALSDLEESLGKQTSLDIRKAAIVCAAEISSGNAAVYIPQILATAGPSAPTLQARMLAVLNTFLMSTDRPTLDESTAASVLEMVLANADSPSSDVRLRVGQCLGSLIADGSAVAQLQNMMEKTTDIARKVTIINAVRDSIKLGATLDLAPFVSVLLPHNPDADATNESCLLLLDSILRYSPAMAANISTQLIPDAAYAHARFWPYKVQVLDLGALR